MGGLPKNSTFLNELIMILSSLNFCVTKQTWWFLDSSEHFQQNYGSRFLIFLLCNFLRFFKIGLKNREIDVQMNLSTPNFWATWKTRPDLESASKALQNNGSAFFYFSLFFTIFDKICFFVHHFLHHKI